MKGELNECQICQKPIPRGHRSLPDYNNRKTCSKACFAQLMRDKWNLVRANNGTSLITDDTWNTRAQFLKRLSRKSKLSAELLEAEWVAQGKDLSEVII